MNNALLFILELEERTAFGNAFRNFFAFITKFIYKFFSGAIDLMYDLATFDFEMSDAIDQIGNKIFNLLIIFMLFKVSISFLTYLVNPDAALDKDKGVAGIIKRIIISVILLMSINPIFNILKDLQGAILDDDIITKIFAVENGKTVNINEDVELVGIKMNSECPSDHYIYTVTKGDRMALLLFRPFLQPESSKDLSFAAKEGVLGDNADEKFSYYCGVGDQELGDIYVFQSQKTNAEKYKEEIKGPNSVEGLLLNYYYNLGVDEADGGGGTPGKGTGGEYFFDFNFIFAIVAGVLGLLIVISFCFDVVIRSLNLIVLQIIAPIPIISYVSPKGKSSEMLGIWGKKILSVWASLFIRIIILSLAIMFIDIACERLNENTSFGNSSLLMNLFIILGILMFAKKLPKLLEELFPGLKLDGGFQLNPFKRIENDALGGKLITGLTGRSVGAITGGLGGAIAGGKAGREVGNPFTGAMLGTLSGIGTGFRNKKWAFGKGMNETYKNLTGNEFRRLTPVSMLMPKMGEQPVKETKGYLKKAYEQLNIKNSDLNISETFSSELATDLMKKGYDIKNIEGMRSKAVSSITESKSSLAGLIAEKEQKELESNSAKQLYDSYQMQYSNALENKNLIQTNCDDCKNQIANLDAEILKQEQSVGKGMIGSFDVAVRDKIEKLKAQRNTVATELDNYIRQLDTANSNIEMLRTNVDSSRANMDIKVEEYNKHIQKIKTVEAEIKSYETDIENIEHYEKHRNDEAQIRNDISAINKDIDTFKKEKAQRERFYRVDPAPQQDYGSAKSNVDERQ